MAGIPFLSGYRGREEQIRRQEHGDLQSAGTLQGMLEKMRARQQEEELRGVMAQAGGDPAKAVQALLSAGTPKSIDLASKLKGMMPKPAEPYTLAPGGQRRGPDNALLAEAPMRPDKPEASPEIVRLQEAAQRYPEGHPLRAQIDSRIKMLGERAPEPLHPIVGPDGKPVLAPRSEAVGKTPFNVSQTGAAEKPKGDFSKSGADFLNSLPEVDRQLVKKIANYDVDPKTLSTRGGHREKMLSLVTQYDPSYDDTQYANKRRAIAQFGSGPQGNTVRSLNVAIEHIDTLKRAADALKNGDFTPGNKAYNEVAKVFGRTPPNTFEGIRDIVANEVIKGTIGNAGALEDRKQAAEKVRAAASPQQLDELMNGWTELMGGQVKGLERQYESSTRNKDFRERYLTPRTRDAISLAESKVVPAAPAAPRGFDADKERRYQEWKKKNGG